MSENPHAAYEGRLSAAQALAGRITAHPLVEALWHRDEAAVHAITVPVDSACYSIYTVDTDDPTQGEEIHLSREAAISFAQFILRTAA